MIRVVLVLIIATMINVMVIAAVFRPAPPKVHRFYTCSWADCRRAEGGGNHAT
jgi:hypothetical protein